MFSNPIDQNFLVLRCYRKKIGFECQLTRRQKTVIWQLLIWQLIEILKPCFMIFSAMHRVSKVLQSESRYQNGLIGFCFVKIGRRVTTERNFTSSDIPGFRNVSCLVLCRELARHDSGHEVPREVQKSGLFDVSRKRVNWVTITVRH